MVKITGGKFLRNRVITGLLLIFCLFANLAQPAFADQETVTAADTGTEEESAENTLILYNLDGTVFWRKTSSSHTFTLPTLSAKSGYTFLGWSKKEGTETDPDYEPGDKVTVSGTLSLYAVFFKRSSEENPKVSRLSSGYDQVIFVGDSRTHSLQLALQKEYGKNGIKKVSFVAKNGSGLSWLKSRGIEQLRDAIRRTHNKKSNARIAVIFNHGVNDLKHNGGKSVNVSSVVSKYSSFMKKIAKELKAEGCDLYYMSVNPVNSGKHSSEWMRRSTEVRSFNKKLRSKLKGLYTFIDCYSYLMENGYSTKCIWGDRKDDGVHYTIKTSKRIYAFCINYLKKHRS